MLPLATFAILQGVLYVAGGAETPFGLFPYIRDERIAENPFAGGKGTNNPDENPSFDAGLSGGVAYAEAQVNSQSESSQTPGGLSLAKWSSVVCTNRPPLIEYYVVDLVKMIKSCKKMVKAFDIRHFTAQIASAIAYDIIYQSHKKVGSPDAQLSAQSVAQAVTATFDKIKKDSLIYIFANSMANSLFFRGVLNQNNVAGLSRKFFQVLKKKVDDVKHPKQEAIIRALGAGFIDYMTSLGHFTASTTPMIALAFVNEMYALCSKCCP